MFKKINTQEILPDAKVGDQENIVKLAPPGRNDRIECWKVRDDLFKCLDKVDIKEEPNACQEYKNLLFNACPNSWVFLVSAITNVFL